MIHTLAISYPESSGVLVSGWAPGETLGTLKKFKFLVWLFLNDFHCFTEKSCGNKIRCPQSLSWRLPTKSLRALGTRLITWRLETERGFEIGLSIE